MTSSIVRSSSTVSSTSMDIRAAGSLTTASSSPLTGAPILRPRNGRIKMAGLAASLLVGLGLAAPAASAPDQVRDLRPIRGSGDRVVSLSLPSGPIIFTLGNYGSSNFIVRLVGSGGEELLVNEIAPWAGATLAPDVRAGRHRLVVEAEGRWEIHPSVPLPARFSTPIIKTHSFKAPLVVAVYSRRSQRLVATANAPGRDNFIVRLVGVGPTSGEDLLFNEIGPYRGQTLVDVPRGTMLLWVQAEGRWSIRFSR